MNKKRALLGTVVILALSFLFHSVYEKFPNIVTSFLFPVNESIWEHNKIVFLSFLVWAICENTFSKSGKSIFFLNLASLIICILLLDKSFSIIYFLILKKKHNLMITLIIYAVSILLSFLIGKKFLIEKNRKVENIALVGYLAIFLILSVLTYYPPELPIFYDYTSNFYGIK